MAHTLVPPCPASHPAPAPWRLLPPCRQQAAGRAHRQPAARAAGGAAGGPAGWRVLWVSLPGQTKPKPKPQPNPLFNPFGPRCWMRPEQSLSCVGPALHRLRTASDSHLRECRACCPTNLRCSWAQLDVDESWPEADRQVRLGDSCVHSLAARQAFGAALLLASQCGRHVRKAVVVPPRVGWGGTTATCAYAAQCARCTRW